MYSNCCSSCSFEPEIIQIGQSSDKIYSNNILNYQESTPILNACTKKSLETYWRHHVVQTYEVEGLLFIFRNWVYSNLNSYKLIWPTVVDGHSVALFSIVTKPKFRRGRYLFTLIAPHVLDPYLVMLSIKKGWSSTIFSLCYDSTWDWT